MWFVKETRHPGVDHPIESILGNESSAEEDNDVRANAFEAAKSFFAVHERHREVEQNQIEVARALAEKIQALKTRLRSFDIEARC